MLRNIQKIVNQTTFADKVKDLIKNQGKQNYKFDDDCDSRNKKLLIQIQKKEIKFHDEDCIVVYFKDVTNGVYES
jgi:hypothetical protein